MLATNNRVVSRKWLHLGSLSTNRHATSLLAEDLRRDGTHLLPLNRVGICDDTLAHLILSTLNRVRSHFLGKEGADHLLHLFKMIGAHFFNQSLMLRLSFDGMK